MRTIELIYDRDCPNVEAARQQLAKALAQAGLPPRWCEWERSDASGPAYARRYGSPTILVEGRDVAGASPAQETNCCRLYRDADQRLSGVPPVEAIAAALNDRPAQSPGRTVAWGAVLPAVGLALLPQLTCPACWPAYAGLLSALGLPFLADSRYLLPITAAGLAVVLAALGIRTKARRGYGPLCLGVAASALVLLGKFAVSSAGLLYGGLALLIAASIWNSWPKRVTTRCPACVSTGTAVPS